MSIIGIMVDLYIPYRCNYGESLYVVGNSSKTGNWDPTKGEFYFFSQFFLLLKHLTYQIIAVRLIWKVGDLWHTRIYLPIPDFQKFQYKYIIKSKDNSNIIWESKENHRLRLERAAINYEKLFESVLQVIRI